MKAFLPPSVLFLTTLAVFSAGCGEKKKDQAVVASATPSASAAPSASTPVEIASAIPAPSAPGLPMIAPRQVPAGPAPNGTWTIGYGIERISDDENLDWSGAIAHCEAKGKSLCLETQWQKACELDPSIGNLESWTLTADYPGAACRGGAEGCKTRAFRKVADKSPTRVGLCCDRAVAITSDDKSDDFRAAASKRVLQFEAAIRAEDQNAGTLGKLFSSKVLLDGIEYDAAAAVSKLTEARKDDPERRSFFDHCNVKMSTEDSSTKLLTDCGVILRTLGKTKGFSQRIAFDGATGPVEYIGDPKGMKPREQKERVRAFLPSE